MSKNRLSRRTKARRRAVDTLYEANLKGLDQDPEDLRELVAQRRCLSTAQTTLPDYAAEIAEGVAEHLFDIDMTLSQYSRSWALDRMPKTDLAILRCSIWEILYNDDVPWKIAVSEAVGTARAISTPESPDFVNGVLDAIGRSSENKASEQ
ncbi:transcription antitermination factor NusB [Varibaculum vaginae]|uniref:transcription antitermination factor NusB n=1 Tax=Varibaculum vaginae TaxID=2364797 RepID=UPI000F098544|nr:transcription antitermination factor NusB [Varibaculum vaginae]